jgi:hypothetical protein
MTSVGDTSTYSSPGNPQQMCRRTARDQTHVRRSFETSGGAHRPEIINVLDKLARSAKAVTAARSLAYARAAFNWAAKREKVPPECVRPSARRHTVERERVLSDAELAVCGRPSRR